MNLTVWSDLSHGWPYPSFQYLVAENATLSLYPRALSHSSTFHLSRKQKLLPFPWAPSLRCCYCTHSSIPSVGCFSRCKDRKLGESWTNDNRYLSIFCPSVSDKQLESQNSTLLWIIEKGGYNSSFSEKKVTGLSAHSGLQKWWSSYAAVKNRGYAVFFFFWFETLQLIYNFVQRRSK